MARSSKSVDKFGKDADKSLKKTSGGFKGIGSAAKLAGGAIAGAGIAASIKSITSAAIESEKSTVKMRAQLKASGLSFQKYGGDIDRVIQKQSRLAALDDEDLQDAFTNIVRTTGSVSKSMNLLGVASDLARGKQINVARAGEIVAKVAGGNTGILSRYGISIEKGATASQALATLQSRFAGQAEAYGKSNAAAADRFNVAVENLKEKLGAKLLPAMSSVASAGTRFITQMENGTGAGGRFAAVAGTVAEAVKRIVNATARFVKGFREGNASMVALGVTAAGLVAGFAAFKVITSVIAAMKGLKAAVIAVNVAMRANPFVAVATVVAALGAALVVAYKKSDTFRNVVNGVFRSVKTIAGDAIAFVLRMLDKFLGGISSVASAAGALPGVGKLFDGFAGKVNKARESLRSAANQADRLGKIPVDTSEIDTAIRKARSLKAALKDSDLVLTPRPRKDKGDVAGPVAGSVTGGLLGGLTGVARGGFSTIAQRFGGVKLTSGYRSPAQNAAVGGAKNSDHLTGNAIDLVPSEGWNPRSIARFDKIAAWARRQANVRFIGWRGQSGHGPGHHLHLSYRAKTALGQSRTMGDPRGTFESTAYGPPWNAMNGTGVTRDGTDLRPAKQAYGIAVDPRRIRLGSKVYAWPNPFGRRGPFKAFDTGGAIKGNRIDFYDWRGRARQNAWGRRSVTVSTSAAAVFGKGGAKAKGRKAIPMSKMGGSTAVPLNDYYQAIADAKAERLGYQPSGGASADGGGAGGDLGGAPAGDAVLDPINARLALAGLTSDTADDLAALTDKDRALAARLAGAQAAGDNQAIIDIAGELKSTREQIEGLRADTRAQTEALLELNQTALAQEREKTRLGQTELGVLKNALAEIVNGNLGGKIGLGFQTVGWAGGTARY